MEGINLDGGWLLLYPGDLQPIFENGFHFVFVGGLAIDAHDGFGSTEADQQPAAILKLELKTIYSDKFSYFQAADCGGLCIENHPFARLAITAEESIHAVIKIFIPQFFEKHLE